MLNKAFTTIVLIASMCITLPVVADSDSMSYPQTDAVESSKIHVFTDKNGRVERLYVEGCTKCPLRLTTSDKTRFKYNGKKIDQKAAKSHSLKVGDVIYDVVKKQALKVNW